jgi:hypothetical protein
MESGPGLIVACSRQIPDPDRLIMIDQRLAGRCPDVFADLDAPPLAPQLLAASARSAAPIAECDLVRRQQRCSRSGAGRPEWLAVVVEIADDLGPAATAPRISRGPAATADRRPVSASRHAVRCISTWSVLAAEVVDIRAVAGPPGRLSYDCAPSPPSQPSQPSPEHSRLDPVHTANCPDRSRLVRRRLRMAGGSARDGAGRIGWRRR